MFSAKSPEGRVWILVHGMLSYRHAVSLPGGGLQGSAAQLRFDASHVPIRSLSCWRKVQPAAEIGLEERDAGLDRLGQAADSTSPLPCAVKPWYGVHASRMSVDVGSYAARE